MKDDNVYLLIQIVAIICVIKVFSTPWRMHVYLAV